MDMELCQLDSIYLFHLSNYNKLLLQRNRLLKDYGFYPEAGTMLDVMDEQLIQYGTALIRSRRAFTDQLQKIIGGIHSSLSGRKEDLTVTYEPNAEETEFWNEKLQENRGEGSSDEADDDRVHIAMIWDLPCMVSICGNTAHRGSNGRLRFP